MLPAEVLTHPAVVSLIERGTPTGSITPEEVRRASEDAAVEPRHLKALLAHLSSLGISVQIPAGTRAVAATGTRKATTTKATATSAATKAPAAKKAPAKSAAPAKAAAKSAAAQGAEDVAEVESAGQVVVGPDGKKVLPDLP